MIPLRDMLPSRRVPIVTICLIAINVLIFLFQGYQGLHQPYRDDWSTQRAAWTEEGLDAPPIFQTYYPLATGQQSIRSLTDIYDIERDDWLQTQYAVIPAEVLSGTDLPPTIPIPIWLTLLTSLFLHGGILHLLGNMLYLWIFGDNVEEAMGSFRFLVFYLLCGAAATWAQIATGTASAIPVLGASGAIAGVLAAYFMLFPQSRILTLIPLFFFLRIVAIPAVFLLGFWFVLQVISGAQSLEGAGGVAFFAHIGGFLAGLVLVIPFRQRSIPLALWNMLQNRRTSRR